MHIMNIKLSNTTLLIIFSLLPIIFALSFFQDPLYYNNQNTYFAHGLAGTGFLNNDWFINTTDPFPVFSGLVKVVAMTLGESGFHFIYLIILAIFAYSILGIAAIIYGFKKTGLQYWLLFIITTAIYSGLVAKIHYLFSADGPLTTGVAMQSVLSSNFQPSSFGVFILLSIYLFLRDKPILAIICLAIAPSFHSTYLLCSAAVTIAYVLITYNKTKDYRKALFLGVLSLVLVLPIVSYNLVNFSPTTPESSHQAQSILVDSRIPHHAKISQWFDKWSFFRIALSVTALYLVRKSQLFLIILVPLITAVGLSLVQLATKNYGLALLFPWRISVLLVPIASIIVLAGTLSFIFKRLDGITAKNGDMIRLALIVPILLMGVFGIRQFMTLMSLPRSGVNPMSTFIASIAQGQDTFLAPIELGTLRLAARVPVFVDYKSHPYKDTEFLEWFDRINISKNIYDPNHLDNACNALTDIAKKYAITDVVWPTSHPIQNCTLLHEIYQDPDYVVYALSKS